MTPTMTTIGPVVILGAGHAGGRVAQHLRQLGFGGAITLVGAEPHLPYERPGLSKDVLTGRAELATLRLQDEAFWQHQYISLRLGVEAVSVDRSARSVALSDGSTLPYGSLVVATGGTPRELTVPGAELPNVLVLRTIDDALALRSHLKPGKRIVIIGGGVIGLEVAASASREGATVTVLEAGNRLMARIASRPVSDWLSALHRANGVVIEFGATVVAISMTTSDSLTLTVKSHADEPREITADVVLVAIGVEPAIGFLSDAGIPLQNGVVVDRFCRSPADPAIYAVGDVANCAQSAAGPSLRQETWRNAENQSRAVAEFLMGRTAPYVELPWMWSDQYDVNLQVVGSPSDGALVIVRGQVKDNAFSVFEMQNGAVISAALVNQGKIRRHVEQLVGRNQVVDPRLLADPTVPIKDLVQAAAA